MGYTDDEHTKAPVMLWLYCLGCEATWEEWI
jgi:hypothetical protein